VPASRPHARLQSPFTSSMDYSLPRLHTKFGLHTFHMHFPTTLAPWLILSGSKNCYNHTILVQFFLNICWLVFVPLQCIHCSAVVMHLCYSSNAFTLDCIQNDTINSLMMTTMIHWMWHNDWKIWGWFGCNKCEDVTERSEHHARWKMV